MIGPEQLAKEIEFAWKAAAMIVGLFVLAFMVEYFVSHETECEEGA